MVLDIGSRTSDIDVTLCQVEVQYAYLYIMSRRWYAGASNSLKRPVMRYCLVLFIMIVGCSSQEVKCKAFCDKATNVCAEHQTSVSGMGACATIGDACIRKCVVDNWDTDKYK